MPVETRVDIAKVERAQVAVTSVLEEELLALGTQLDGMVKRNIRDKNAINTSALVGSYAATMPGDTPGTISVRVGTPLDYGNHIEFGTRPHLPPLQAIMEWVENKLNVISLGVSFESGRAKPTGKGVRQFSKIRNRDARQAAILKVAQAIRFSIAKRGTKPRHVVKDALDAMGLAYQRGGDYVYHIDAIQSLAKNGNEFWAKVQQRMQ